jgi:copper chaperone CopZ
MIYGINQRGLKGGPRYFATTHPRPATGWRARRRQELDTIRLKIDGMSCGHCLRTVSETLRNAPGVVQVGTVEMGRAEVTIDGGVTSPAKVAEAVTEAGYGATVV